VGSAQGAQPASRGLVAELLSLVGSFGRHVQSLGALAGEEAREAGALYLRLAIMLFAAIFFAAFGYVLVLLFLAFLIATIFHVAWIWILLGFSILHLLGAFLCASHVKNHWHTPVFSATASEIRRDLDSLKVQP
jgi:uncharacterized membrane protein YqjE